MHEEGKGSTCCLRGVAPIRQSALLRSSQEEQPSDLLNSDMS